jgi:hypothetical protein
MERHSLADPNKRVLAAVHRESSDGLGNVTLEDVPTEDDLA